MYYIVSILFLLFVWCTGMAIDVMCSVTVGFSPTLYC